MKPRPLVLRFVLLLAALAVGALLLAGCGGGGGGSTDPADVAPPESGLLIEGVVQPEGELQANVEVLAQRVAGISDLGGKIVSELESSALNHGEKLDFEKEVKPWLGERAAIALTHFDGNNFSGGVGALQVTDSGEAEAFIAKQVGGNGAKEGSYEGVTYWAEGDGTTFGVFDGLLVFGEDEAAFKAAVDASQGESLADQERFKTAMEAAPSGSLADLYVDVGGLIKQASGSLSAEDQLFFEFAGIEPKKATAVASVVPGSDRVEVDFSTNLVGKNPPKGDASKLLGSFPADSVGGFVSAEYGRVLGEQLDQLDAKGIPGQVPPHQFKKALGEAGIDVEAIASSIGDIGAFVEGSTQANLGGALVLDTKGASEAKNTVANIGLLLRASGTPGVTAVNGKVSGFSVRSAELGRQPIVVASGGSRIAIAYGLPAAVKALAEPSGQTLADSPAYKEAVASLGSTPISGFIDGPAAVHLVLALVPRGEKGFEEALPYLEKISYVAIGSGTSGELATARVIFGVGK
ncbi:MAG TPA: DUF3352 domain-containing protein [Solirubrobacterales bacterium]